MQAPKDLQPNKKYPVVMIFHGHGGYAQRAARMMRREVDRYQFIGVYPQGYENSWNLGGSKESMADDMGFVDQIVERLRSTSQVMSDEVYAIGMSNGAAMVNKIVVQRSYLKGIAAFSSTLITDLKPSEAVLPVSVLQIRGMRDHVIPYGGGYADKVGHDFLSLEDTLAFWAKNNQCEVGPKVATTEEGNKKISYTRCKSNTQVIGYACPYCRHSIPRKLEGGLIDLAMSFFNERSHVFQMYSATYEREPRKRRPKNPRPFGRRQPHPRF